MNLTEAEIAARLREAASAASDAAADPPANSLKCAAVLMPLLQSGGEWHLLFTRRAEEVESHKGQVSFPGGACDRGETTPEQTALREAWEEIGILPGDVRLLGRLAPMETITNFLVTPVVGVIPWPYVFRPARGEVARVFTMPLRWLADKANRWEFNALGSKYSVVLYHPYDGETLWGATARMTVEFVGLMQRS